MAELRNGAIALTLGSAVERGWAMRGEFSASERETRGETIGALVSVLSATYMQNEEGRGRLQAREREKDE